MPPHVVYYSLLPPMTSEMSNRHQEHSDLHHMPQAGSKQKSHVQRRTQRGMALTLIFLAGVLWLVFPPSSRKGDHTLAPFDDASDLQSPIAVVPHIQDEATKAVHIEGMLEDRGENNVDASGTRPQHTVVTFLMSNSMSIAWRESSKRLTFPTKVSVKVPGGVLHLQEALLAARATLYGKSSLKIKYTKRRSLHMDFDSPIRLDAGGPSMRSIVLLSLWEDKYRLAYRSSVELLRQLGIFQSKARLVELRCEALQTSLSDVGADNYCHGGVSLGTYLLLEYPSDAIVRAAREEASNPQQRICESTASFANRKLLLGSIVSAAGPTVPVEVGTRNWFYFERPKKYDILHVPSYKRNSSISAAYAQLEKDPGGWSVEHSIAAGQRFDLDAYLTWIAVNSVLMNGDYDDEVFFYRSGGDGKDLGLLSIMAWDYDTVFARCHRKEAVPSRIMYCAETPIEQRISSDPALQRRYRDILDCIIRRVATPSNWESIVHRSLGELEAIMASSKASAKATFDDSRHPPDPREGAKALVASLKERVGDLSGALPASPGQQRGDAMDDANTHDHSVRPSTCDVPSLRRQLASQLKKGLPREHKAGRGVVSVQGLPTPASVHITFPVKPSDDTVREEVLHAKDSSASPSIVLDQPGLYCANVSVSCNGRPVSWLQTFVLRSKERGSAEFALPHFHKPEPMQLATNSDTIDRDGKLRLLAAVPVRWVLGNWFPVILRLTSPEWSAWHRRNVALELEESGGRSGGQRTLLVRGLSAVRIVTAQASELTEERDGPLLKISSLNTDFNIRVSQTKASTLISRVAPVDLSGADPIPSFQGIERMMGDNCVVVLEDVTTIELGQSVSIGAGCIIVLKVGATLNVFGVLSIEGTSLQPVTITSSGEDQPWVSIVVSGSGASLSLNHVFVTGSGVKGRLTPNTGKHHKHSAAVTVIDSAAVTVRDAYFIALSGPAFAAGSRGSVRISHSVVQWAELGVECVQCDFHSRASTWTHFPSWSPTYEDDDNDAMYLSGGTHRVDDSVVAHAKDDCIDSGTPEKSAGDGGSLLVANTILEMCQHEAIALSSSPKGRRHARLSKLWIEHAQQGIESGYTGRQHHAEAEDVFISSTNVAVRYGDNYYNRPQNGELHAKRLLLEHNVVNTLNYVRELGGPQLTAAFHVDVDSSILMEDTMSKALRNTPGAVACPGISAPPTHNAESRDGRREELRSSLDTVQWDG